MVQKPMPSLKWSPQLAKAAIDHVNDIGPKGITISLGSGKLPNQFLTQLQMDPYQPTG
jgi:hypothetical protein